MHRHCIDVGDWKERLLQRYLDEGRIQAHESRPSENVYYAANQILVGAADVERNVRLFARLGAKPVADAGVLPGGPDRPSADAIDRIAAERAPENRRALVAGRGDVELEDVPVTGASPVTALALDPRIDVAQLVLELRDSRARRGLSVSLNHLATGMQVRRGFPDGDPELIDDQFGPMPRGKELPGAGVGVAVVDTGFPIAWPASVDWFDQGVSWKSLSGEADHVDLLDDDRNGFLDAEAGHGLFVAGMVRRVAPGARLFFLRALDANGFGTEVGVARAIRQAVRRPIDVLNLSLGFYTLQNTTPDGVVAALRDARRVRPGLAVVSAAGNDGTTSPTYPAALKHVVAVGALDGAAKGLASFSNRGPWVDVHAPGTWQHGPYVDGVEDASITRDGNSDTFDGRARWSGTSFACGLVSGGVAAAIDHVRPPEEVATALVDGLPPLAGTFGTVLDPTIVL